MQGAARDLLKQTGRKGMELLSTLSPVFASKMLYRYAFHRPIDLKHPKTLNDKLMWLKLHTYRDNPLVTQCADKYRVREYVEAQGCGALLNTLLGVWRSVDEIDWDALPAQFALKCNHGCGYNIICSDKAGFDIADARRRLDRWMHTDFWKRRAEINYKGIEKRILCEAYLGTKRGLLPEDYKIYCFHGKALYILMCTEREKQATRFYFFDRAWRLARLNPDSVAAPEGFSLPRPACLDEMLEAAQRLSAPFPFVRVDFYAVKERPVFGEMTFTPSAALDKDRLPETDLAFGSLLHLPIDQNEERKDDYK